MKKSAKLSLALALMMGTTAGVNMVAPSSASAEISDKFKLEVNGVTSYYHDTAHNYYGMTRTDNTRQGKGWNNYTRVVFNYYVDKDLSMHARLFSNYDAAGDFAGNTNKTGAYFDQAYLQYHDRKNDLHYILGKKGMTLGQSMVYNSTGNLTGAQVSWGNWYDPRCVQLTYGDTNPVNTNYKNANSGGGGNRVWSAQWTQATSKATKLNATYLRGEKLTEAGIKNHSSFIDFGGKVKMHGWTIVGEWARNQAGRNINGTNLVKRNQDRQAWYAEVYTGPTNDFGSGLPNQKVGTHAFAVRWQDLGADGTYVHNNTFYDDKKGLRLDYGMVVKKGLSVDFVYGRMKDKGTSTYNDKRYGNYKGQYSNIFVVSANYKFK